MASQQQYHAYHQNKGTLTPGQSISVNKFNVTVERYLSQGGFSHVYLVRTATPVYNTTHHVLKRIAVASEEMLGEVKKEVDIMRLLKGHPNIVHLIDAAWHKMPSGTYEVFILMEFCPGGGIIDMMNRRLRERLTEAEILQIFVDVCEGVACMHNSQPSLLHRDLKVENILQSSSTSYKLCDFGSATIVSKPPANTHEIRALEADLNRHTTLQYRAPEMVDLFSRRPVDEKSDVWALGVLLYKLCYYTTPFEEHGPLAIINVQYRIPPYPQYSTQMNQLIGSMLQEHGSQRPSIFELLAQVHHLRGTKSRFQYTIPIPQPLSPRHQTQLRPSTSNHVESLVSSQLLQPISDSRKSDSISSPSLPSKNQVYARDGTADDSPLTRRGRPTSSKGHLSGSKPEALQNLSGTRPTSSEKPKPWAEGDFISEGDRSWKTAIAKSEASRKDGLDGAWKVGGTDLLATGEKRDTEQGFVDDFAEKLWESFEDKPNSSTQIKAPYINSTARSTFVSPKTLVRPSPSKGKDAFEGLGLESSLDRPAPTLGEARKLRTGLAILSTRQNGSDDKVGPSSSRLTPPRQQYLSSSPSQQSFLSSPARPSSSASGMSWRTSPQPGPRPSSSVQPESLPAEARFPSLEDLDATFASNIKQANHTTKSHVQQAPDAPALPPRSNRHGRSVPGMSGLLVTPTQPRGQDGVRSEQVTGVAMRELRPDTNHRRDGVEGPSRIESKASNGLQPSSQSNREKRPSLTRRHRSSISIKHAPSNIAEDVGPVSPLSSLTTEKLATSSPRLPAESRDWLTGEDDPQETSASVLVPALPVETVVFRESPSKRASVIPRSTLPIQDAVFPQHDHTPLLRRTPSPSPSGPAVSDVSPTISRFQRNFPPIETPDNVQRDRVLALSQDQTPVVTRTARKPVEPESSSSAEEGPEDAGGFKRTPVKYPASIGKPKRKGRQSSVHDLVDLWGGGVGHKDNERDTLTPRTSHDDTTGHKQARPVVAPLTSAKSSPKTPLLTPPRTNSRSQQTPISNLRPSPISDDTTSSTASRSRPQSMIIFPSKSVDTYPVLPAGHASASLAPPSPPSKRTGVRRTSISNMVQRYEGIGKPPGSIGSPSAKLSRSATTRVGSSVMAEDGRYSKGQRQKDQAGLTPPVSSDTSHSWSSNSPTKDAGFSPNISPDTLRVSRSPTSLIHKGLDESVPRTPKLSFNREASRPVFSSSSKPAEDPPSRPGDERSSSPERPYQGVGKLIDQWQRKTAEASSVTRSPIGRGRGTFVAARGIAQSIPGESQ